MKSSTINEILACLIMNKKPSITKSTTIAKSRLFSIEKVNLLFSNGEQHEYERIIAPGNGAVMIIPVINETTVIMIREYSVGTDRYELAFPKGLISAGESIEDAANREIMEEIGFASKKLSHIDSMTIAPGYLSFTTHIVLAEDLYDKQLDGDEPEQLETVECDLTKFDQIIKHPELTEARSKAALYIVRDILLAHPSHV